MKKKKKKFSEKITAQEIYHLSSSSQNILNWYPFKEKDTVLEIGGNLGNLTEVFINKCKEVTTIEPNLEKAKTISKRYNGARYEIKPNDTKVRKVFIRKWKIFNSCR